MEYDADVCEAKLSGSDAFADTTRRVIDLTLAERASIEVAIGMLETENRLAEDWGLFLMENIKDLPADKVAEVRDALIAEPTRWADTHPSSGDRIKAVAKLEATGLFTMRSHPLLEAARDESYEPGLIDVLLNDLPGVARELTMRLYAEKLPTPPESEQLVPISHVREHKDNMARIDAASERFYQTAIPSNRPLVVDLDRELDVADETELAALLRAGRKAMVQVCKGYEGAVELVDRTFKRWMELRGAGMLVEAGYMLNPVAFSIPDLRPDTISKHVRRAVDHLSERQERLKPFEAALYDRLSDALAALRLPWLQEAHPELAETATQLEAFRPALAYLTETIEARSQLQMQLELTLCLLYHLEAAGQPKAYERFRARLVGCATMSRNNCCTPQMTCLIPFRMPPRI